MKKIISFLILLVVVFIMIIGIRTATVIMKNETEKFLGDKENWSDIKMELQDIHGLWGGRNITVLGSGKATAQIVTPSVVPPQTVVDPNTSYGLYQKTYEFSIEDVELNSLIDLFIKNDFLTIDIKNRLGIPDESKPKIVLTNPDGQYRAVEVWINDLQKNGSSIKRFANIYGRFIGIEMGIETNSDSLKPVSEGIWR